VSDLFHKRKLAGEPHKDKRRKPAPDTEHLPPHKKPKVWTLTLEWTETVTYRRTKSFASRAARDESRARIERHFREQEAKLKAQPKRSYERSFGAWYARSPFYEYRDEVVNHLKSGPEYVETYEEQK
jgi:hypothetical protein